MVVQRKWRLCVCSILLALILRFCFTACDFIAYSIIFLALVWMVFQALQYLHTSHPASARHLKCLWIVCLSIFALWFCGTEIYLVTGVKTASDHNAKYVVVLGAQVRGQTPSRAMLDRTKAAVDYLNQHPAAICIVSGGKGPGEEITEAACMQTLLLQQGIAEDRIWLESRATNTAENIAYTLQLITEKTGEPPAEIAIVSSEYHLRRAQLVAKRQGCYALPIAGHTSLLFMKINYYIREAFGLCYYVLFQ